MRDIRFRGLSVNGDWYYGLLSESQGGRGHQPPKGFYISNSAGMPWAYEVRPETVGQYTSFKDKDNIEIWELDILQIDDPEDKARCIVVFVEGAYRKKYINWDMSLPYPILSKSELDMWKVIGNIFKNIYLMEI